MKTWEDVDWALGEIRSLQAELGDHAEKFGKEKDRIGKQVARHEEQIEHYVRAHEDELQERIRVLSCGKVWLRLSPGRLTARSWAKVLERLKERGFRRYIRIPTDEEVNKEALKDAPEDVLRAVGAKITQDDVFGYSVVPN